MASHKANAAKTLAALCVPCKNRASQASNGSLPAHNIPLFNQKSVFCCKENHFTGRLWRIIARQKTSSAFNTCMA